MSWRSHRLEVWTIERRPSEPLFPYIARRQVVKKRNGSPEVAEAFETLSGSTLDRVRSKLPEGLTMVPRLAEDPPKVIERWV